MEGTGETVLLSDIRETRSEITARGIGVLKEKPRP